MLPEHGQTLIGKRKNKWHLHVVLITKVTFSNARKLFGMIFSKMSRVLFRPSATSKPNIIRIRFDSSTAEPWLWFTCWARVMQNSGLTEAKYWFILVTLSGSAILPLFKLNIIYNFCLARQRHNIWIGVMPELCSMAELVKLNCLQNLIKNFHLDNMLPPCSCQT